MTKLTTFLHKLYISLTWPFLSFKLIYKTPAFLVWFGVGFCLSYLTSQVLPPMISQSLLIIIWLAASLILKKQNGPKLDQIEFWQMLDVFLSGLILYFPFLLVI